MREILAALFLLLIFSPALASMPGKYADYSVYAEIREGGTINQKINLTFPENITAFDYYLLHPAYVRFFDGASLINCTSSLEGLGTIVGCQGINNQRLTLQFDYEKLVKQNGQFFTLSDQYIFLTPTDNFTLRVILPKGYVVSQTGAGPNNSSYYPSGAVQVTDGQQIYLEWKRQKLNASVVFSYSVSYEKALETQDNSGLFVVIGAAVAIIIALLMVIYFRKKPTLKEYGLNEDERKILDVLLKEKKVSQKKIVRETGFSKAHVSRLSKNLESRGIIERKRTGRTYEVSLKD